VSTKHCGLKESEQFIPEQGSQVLNEGKSENGWTCLSLLILLLMLLLLCSDSWETCLFPAVSIAIAACQRNLYIYFFQREKYLV